MPILLLYCHLQHHNDTIIKTLEDFFNKIFTSHFIARVRKGLLKVCMREGAETEQKRKYFDPHSYGRQRCVFLVLQMLNRRSRGPLCWVMAFFTASYQQLPWTPTHQSPKPLRPDVTFPTTSRLLRLQLYWNSNSVLTELYNSSTPTRSPTRSLEPNVGSSSSGNNCHAVQRSLPSGASVYECTVGIFLTRPISLANFRPRDFRS